MRIEEIRIIERDELILAVIEKHEKMIAEYTAEYDALKNRSGVLDAEIIDLKKRIEENDEKTRVYDEKKHLSGRDASEELKKLNLKQIDSEKIENGITALTSSKISDSIDERKAVYETLCADVNNAGAADSSVLLAKITAAYESYKEENRLIEAVSADNAVLTQKQGVVQEDKRADWLEKRVSSHKDSLDYWKGMK
ncbi:MAG: hypothetical protein FWE54_01930 [Methanimicrococcus sp.]|nr:hypothetical protein [Methanimicrococcus sp.]